MVCWQRIYTLLPLLGGLMVPTAALAHASIISSVKIPPRVSFTIPPYLSDPFDKVDATNCADYKDVSVISFEVYATAPGFALCVHHNGQLESNDNTLAYTLQHEGNPLNDGALLPLAKGKNSFNLVITLTHTNLCTFKAGDFKTPINLSVHSA